MNNYQFSKKEAQNLVNQLYKAADEENDSSIYMLVDKLDQFSEFLENENHFATAEEINELSNECLKIFDQHGFMESDALAKWAARHTISNGKDFVGVYKSLHHFFEVLTAINEDKESLENFYDASGKLVSIIHIDASALNSILNHPNRKEAAYFLDNSKFQAKVKQAIALSKHFPPEHYSHLDRAGNKHKNNVIQRFLVKALKIPGIIVPDSKKVETEQTLIFLKKYAPNVLTAWEKLGDLYRREEIKDASFFKKQEVINLLSEIVNGITNAFKNVSDEEIIQTLDLSQDTFTWIDDVKKRNCFLMVRSSGAEDSKTSANAGGNISVAYVTPEPEEYLAAIGEVVCSFFGEQSLKNRLNAGQNPFEEPLQLAVTMQELIGEAIGGSNKRSEIPVSLVLFTNEPLYVGKEKFRVMRFSATYGHGEGVVGYKGIASDTILLIQSASRPDKIHIIYDNQHKPERLAPVMDKKTGKVKLKKILNPPEMANQPALNKYQIGRLFQWGVIGEMYFNERPQDKEIIFKDNIMYLVQTRPVNRQDLLPNYLDLKKIQDLPESPILETLHMEMIVPGKGSVVQINEPEELLANETLDGAETLYEKEEDKLVIARQQKGANSHPVVNFSNMGTPCLHAKGKKYDQTIDMVDKIDEDHHLAVCMQAATISLWDTSKGSIEDCTTKGFVAHPAKIAISFPSEGEVFQKSGEIPEISEDLKTLFLELKTASTFKVALEFFHKLKNHHWLKDYKGRIDELKKEMDKNPLLNKTVKPIVSAACSVEAKVNQAFEEIDRLLIEQDESKRMELLIQIKILETTFFQESAEGAIGHYSILNMNEKFEAANALIEYQNHLTHLAHFAELLMDGSQCPVEDTFKDWMQFLFNLEPVVQKTIEGEWTGLKKADIETFKETLKKLRNANVLPLFMTFFLQDYTSLNPVEAIKSINLLMPANEQPLVEKLFESKKKIQKLKMDINAFQDPKAFEDAFKRLKKITDSFLSSKQSWLKKYQWGKTSPMIRNIAVQTMNELVDLWDTAIKSMKKTPAQLMSDRQRVSEFKKMLTPFLSLMCEWVENTVGDENFSSHTDYLVNQYLNKIKQTLQDLSDNPEQLKPSSGFSVNAAILNSQTAFNRHLPQTLEDIFTLIHQNLIVCTNMLTKDLISSDRIQSSLLPDMLKLAVKNSNKIMFNLRGMEGLKNQTSALTGISVNHSSITFNYNLALRNHSSKFHFHYERPTNKLTMQAHFLGTNAGRRWQQGASRVLIQNAANLIPLQEKPKYNHQELTYTWELLSEEQFNRAVNEYNTFGFMTIGGLYNNNEFSNDLLIGGGNLLEVALFCNTERIDEYNKKLVIKFYVDKIINEFNKEITINNESFLKLFFNRSNEDINVLALLNPVVFHLTNALVAQINGEDSTNILENIPLKNHKEFVEHQLHCFATDKNYIHYLPSNAIKVWEALFKQGKGIPEALATIRRDLNNKNEETYLDIICLLEKILNLNIDELYPDALVILKILENKTTRYIEEENDSFPFYISKFKMNQIKLWDKLLAKGQGLQEITLFINKFAKSSNLILKSYSLYLMEVLVKANQDPVEMIEAAKKIAIKSFERIESEALLNLWNTLLAKKLGVDEAIDCVNKGLDEAVIIQSNAIELLNKLITNGYENEALILIQKGLNVQNSKISSKCLDLYTSIIEKNENEILPEVISTAYELFKVDDRDVLLAVKKFYGLLIERGQTFEVIKSARQGVQYEYSNNRLSSLSLFDNMVEKGIGIPEAIEAAQLGIKDKIHDVRTYALKLWVQLKPYLNDTKGKEALKKTLSDYKYWQCVIPSNLSYYHSNYLATLTKLGEEMKNILID